MDKNKLADQLTEKIRQDFFDTFDRVFPIEDYHNGHFPNRGTLAVHLMAVVGRAARAGFDASNEQANHINLTLHEKITDLEQELKLEKMRGDHNSYCPNHQETKGLIVTEEFKANGVVVDCQFYKCPECDMTWLSGRQEHDVDMKIKSALESKIQELQEQLSKLKNVVTPEENELASLRNFKDFFQPRMTELKSKLTHETNMASNYCELANKQAGEILQLNDKIAELEQHQKDMELLFRQQQETITALSLKEKELEQRLKKAESVIGFYGDKTNWICESVTSSDVESFDSKYNHESQAGGKLARQYLKSRGE